MREFINNGWFIMYVMLGWASCILSDIYVMESNEKKSPLTKQYKVGILLSGPTFMLAALGGYSVTILRKRRET